MAQHKVDKKIYQAMNKEVPSKMRSVIKNAIASFRDGIVDKGDVQQMLKKNFSDKTFENILDCVQGNLHRCNKIDLDKWRESANLDVEAVAEKARIRQQKAK